MARYRWVEVPHPLFAEWWDEWQVSWVNRFWKDIHRPYFLWEVTEEDANYIQNRLEQASDMLLDHMASIPSPREKLEHAKAAYENCWAERREYRLLMRLHARMHEAANCRRAGVANSDGLDFEKTHGGIYRTCANWLYEQAEYKIFDRARSYFQVRKPEWKRLRRRYDRSKRAKMLRAERRRDPAVLERERQLQRQRRAAKRALLAAKAKRSGQQRQ